MAEDKIKVPKNQFELDIEAALKSFEGQQMSEVMKVLIVNKLNGVLKKYKEQGEEIVETLTKKPVIGFTVKMDYKLNRIITFPVTA